MSDVEKAAAVVMDMVMIYKHAAPGPASERAWNVVNVTIGALVSLAKHEAVAAMEAG